MMENKFTPRAEEALRLAQEAAEDMGHGYVGSEHLLEAIEAQAAKLELVQDILLESTSREASKSGISPEELSAWPPRRFGRPHVPLRGPQWQSLPWPPGRTETARFLQKCVSFMLT